MNPRAPLLWCSLSRESYAAGVVPSCSARCTGPKCATGQRAASTCIVCPTVDLSRRPRPRVTCSCSEGSGPGSARTFRQRLERLDTIGWERIHSVW
ncbi:hypothetical protein PF004_g12888 [Phytophthora fragariae]|uniref:Uncharacterized protein n=1 Tax=Phytophthora fragariae TaxID=53985 RepID=A0A6G0NTS8_9STRA|nr:hypothetical protein PF004_g12888 [Phytophthora fragariae]